MDTIVAQALVGTARQEQVQPETGTAVDALVGELSGIEDERRLLLSAGARAIYCRAGQQALRIAAIPEPAPPEKLRPCPPRAAALLACIFDDAYSNLLPEALERLRTLGMRLPYHLLPAALDRKGAALHALILPVLGERGLWLSRFRAEWRWVNDYLPTAESGLTADAEAIWQIGMMAQRAEILRRQRAVDPARGREWLADVWRRERSAVRAMLLNALKVGLSAADEEFLEKALDDRSMDVRAASAELLRLLPDSALAVRMLERGSAMLRMHEGKLNVRASIEPDASWWRDGIIEQPTHINIGKHAWRLVQVLAAISPTFWEQRFSRSPTELLAALPDDDKWAVHIVDGWVQAAVRYRAYNWMTPLWSYLQENSNRIKPFLTYTSLCEKLLSCMPREEAENILLALLRKDDRSWGAEMVLHSLLLALPRPWSGEFSRACLSLLRQYCSSFSEASDASSEMWRCCLPIMAQSLSAGCLSEAQQVQNYPIGGEDSRNNALTSQVQRFSQITALRQKIYEEIV